MPTLFGAPQFKGLLFGETDEQKRRRLNQVIPTVSPKPPTAPKAPQADSPVQSPQPVQRPQNPQPKFNAPVFKSPVMNAKTFDIKALRLNNPQDDARKKLETERTQTKAAAKQLADRTMEHKDAPLTQLGGHTVNDVLTKFQAAQPTAQRDTVNNLRKIVEDTKDNYAGKPELTDKYNQAKLILNLLEDRGNQRSDTSTKIKNFAAGAKSFAGALLESPRKVGMVIDELGGAQDPTIRLTAEYKAGKMSAEEYNSQMNRVARGLDWAGTGYKDGKKESRSKDLIKATGISADTVATILPVLSAARGGKVALTAEKLAAEAGGQSLKRTVAEEALSNALFSGVGSLREGEVNPSNILKETVTGGVIGGSAPIVGNKVGKMIGALKSTIPKIDVAASMLDELNFETPSYQKPEYAPASSQEKYKLSSEKARGEGDLYYEMRQKGLNPGDVQDVPSYIRKDLDGNIAKAETELSAIDKQLAAVPNSTPESMRFELQRQLAEDIKAKPAAKDALISLYQSRLEHLGSFSDLTAFKDDLVQKRQTLQNAVDSGKRLQEELAAKVDQGQQAVQEVAQNTADQVAPVDVTAPQATPTPEAEANNAYSSGLEQYAAEGGKSGADVADELLKSLGYRVSADETNANLLYKIMHKPGSIYKGIVDNVSDKASDVLRSGIYSKNSVTSRVAEIPRLAFARAGFNNAQREVLRSLGGGKSAITDAIHFVANDLEKKMAAIGDKALLTERLTRFFESPDYVGRAFGDATKLAYKDLSSAEQEIVDKLITFNKVRNMANFETGLINEDQFKQFANGMHSPRLYDLKNPDNIYSDRIGTSLDKTASVQRKDLSDIPDSVFDKRIDNPTQSMLYRLESSLHNLDTLGRIKKLDEVGLVFDTPPNNGFTQLEGAQYGDFKGKWVDNQVATELLGKTQFKTGLGKQTDALLDVYRGSFVGKLDRFAKQTKTIFAPGTFLGNVFSNPLAFNRGAGVDILSQSAGMVSAATDLIEHRAMGKFNPLVYELEKSGAFGSNSARAISGEIADGSLLKDNTWKKNPIASMKHIYGGVDDAAKLAMYKNLLKNGETKEVALRRVAQFSQDYANAGRLVQILADSPVLGKPFARFVPELIRITKNNLAYNPLGMVAGLSALAVVQKELSDTSGETPDQRASRENAPGQTLLPGTAWINRLVGGGDRDISLNFPVNGTAVNIARITGMNFPQEPNGDAGTALLKQLLPVTPPTRENAQGQTVFAPAELISSLALSPIADQIANRDFLGRKITDPTNKVVYDGNGMEINKFSGEQKPGQENFNRAKTLLMNYLPLANEGNAIYSAAKGQEDYYGKDRSMLQSIGRALGVKIESNTPDVREKRVDTQRYFEEDKVALNKFLGENPDLAASYWKIKNPTKNRTTSIKDNETITPEKWDVINSDTSSKLYGFLKDQALLSNAKDGKPVDPVYKLDPIHSKYVTELRSRPSGDDIEAVEILRATQPWYQQFEKDQTKYYTDNEAYFKANPINGDAKDNPRITAYREASVPVEQPDIVKAYYKIKSETPDLAKGFYKANKDALSAAFDKYANDRLGRLNAMRKIEGYDPIDKEVFKNSTFGFDIKGGSSGFGYGSGGGGGWTPYVNENNKLNNLTSTSIGSPLGAIDPQDMPQIQTLLRKLFASQGGRARVQLGAASRGKG